MKRKFRAKCRFRAVARMVMANYYWMIEAAEQYEGVEDVKRRVAQAVRGKAKKKRLLAITDKALLNKPNSERTDEEKKYIYRIIGGLKCFKKYPNHVKKKLAAVTYFKYYSPNRVIVRQHHEAHALYFIVTGDVIVSQSVFDELLQQYVQVDIDVKHHSSSTKKDSLTTSDTTAPSGTADTSSAMRSSMEADLSSPGEQRSPSRSVLLLAPSEHRESVRFSVQHQLRPKNLRTYFMQVCRFYPGSTFGFGENMRDRRIIALTPVDCMLLPKMWLLQRNTANIWSRIQHFLEKKIPTKRQLFREFVSARRWQEFRDQLVGDIVARSKTVNLTSVHDVPYSIRMEEMLDI
ncbi:unnamed protein product [Spodoptera exigua]|nr:unnamed protein product [Spodoptera exigua]